MKTTRLPNLVLSSTRLPTTYRKSANIEIYIANTMENGGRGQTVEVAEFKSSTPGHVDAYFKRTEAGIFEIGFDEYKKWVLQSLGMTEPDGVIKAAHFLIASLDEAETKPNGISMLRLELSKFKNAKELW